MHETPQAPPTPLFREIAPGAKAAKVCGILSIVFALTCLGIPVAVVLGIVALVQQAKAKRALREEPDRYEPVPATGMVTGIIGLVLPVVLLPFIGIASAIAIPALLGQRSRAQALAGHSNLSVVMQDLQVRHGDLVAQGVPPERWAEEFEKVLQVSAPALKNPLDATQPSMETRVILVEAADAEAVEAAARAQARRPGVVVFAMSRPGQEGGAAGFLAAALESARTPRPDSTLTRVMPLD